MKSEELTNIIEKFGFIGGLVVLLMFIFVSFFNSSVFINFLTKTLESIVKKIIKKSEFSNIKISESDILNHDLFNYIDFWINIKIPTCRFDTNYRTEVFKKYMTLYLLSYKKKLYEFVKSKKYQTMNNTELWNSFFELLNGIVMDYEKEMMIVGINDVVINKMKYINNKMFSLTIELIRGICNSNFYASEKNYLKVYSILNILLSMLENSITIFEDEFVNMNGELSGLMFNGYVEP